MGEPVNRESRRLAADIDDIDDRFHPELRAVYRRYATPIRYMVDHFASMMRPSKRSAYDDAELLGLLRACGSRLPS